MYASTEVAAQWRDGVFHLGPITAASCLPKVALYTLGAALCQQNNLPTSGSQSGEARVTTGE